MTALTMKTLVHANCKDIYIEQAYICADFGPTMMFSDAYMLMKQGAKVKLPNWGGYWYWDAEKKTIMIHTKDGEELDIRQTERPEYTFDNIASDEWQIADEENARNSVAKLLLGSGCVQIPGAWHQSSKKGLEREGDLS